jgi:hypothetical protein
MSIPLTRLSSVLVEQRALARAALADQHHKLARVEGGADLVQHHALAAGLRKALADLIQPDQWRMFAAIRGNCRSHMYPDSGDDF